MARKTGFARPGSPEAQEIGRKIQRLRLAQGLKRMQLGRAIGAPNTVYIDKIEAGRTVPGVASLAKIALVLGVATSDLLPTEPVVPVSVALFRASGLSEEDAEELLQRFREAEAEIRARRLASNSKPTEPKGVGPPEA